MQLCVIESRVSTWQQNPKNFRVDECGNEEPDPPKKAAPHLVVNANSRVPTAAAIPMASVPVWRNALGVSGRPHPPVNVHEVFGHGYSFACRYTRTAECEGTIIDPQTGQENTKRADEAMGLTAENLYRLQHGERLRTYYEHPGDWTAPPWLLPYINAQRAADVSAVARKKKVEEDRLQKMKSGDHLTWIDRHR